MKSFETTVVYVGPSIRISEVKEHLPGAMIRPPIKRGDLHRDRFLLFSVFVIIDGIFFHDDALPLREIISIIQDGAEVFGGSSLGALRAAELWPVGMKGVGTIYKLFRTNYLKSDDEVAVCFDPEKANPPLTIALIDIRWALRRALRRGFISSMQYNELLNDAQMLYFTDRTWSALLAKRNLSSEALDSLRASPSLKEIDAIRVLNEVKHFVTFIFEEKDHERMSTAPFIDIQLVREPNYNPIEHIKTHLDLALFCEWAIRSGYASGSTSDGIKRILNCISSNECTEVCEELQERDDIQSLGVHYIAWRSGLDYATSHCIHPSDKHITASEYILVQLYGSTEWSLLLSSGIRTQSEFEHTRRELATIIAVREILLTNSSKL